MQPHTLKGWLATWGSKPGVKEQGLEVPVSSALGCSQWVLSGAPGESRQAPGGPYQHLPAHPQNQFLSVPYQERE